MVQYNSPSKQLDVLSQLHINCGILSHGGFASGDRAPFVLTSSGPGSAHTRRSGRVWEVAVWGVTGRWTLTLATSLDPTDASITTEATRVTQQKLPIVVYRYRMCTVCKSTNELLMWGRYSHIDTSPHKPQRKTSHRFPVLCCLFWWFLNSSYVSDMMKHKRTVPKLRSAKYTRSSTAFWGSHW
jgi:hypothetical protein